MTTYITITWNDGTRCEAPVLDRAAGLCVTEITVDGETLYTVTHKGSGIKVFPRRYRRCDDPAQATRAMYAAAGVDWTDSLGDLIAQRERILPVLNRMRLAAWPVRRPRWHKGVRKVRMLPYKAQTKREAVRDTASLSYLSFHDVWVYKRRGPFWGTMPAVIRQPCTRFGVAHQEREEV
jgi:hypothetical protein